MRKKTPPLTDLMTLTALAKSHSVPISTLHDAIRGGRLTAWKTRCGLKLSTDAAVIAYIQKPETLGRPRGWSA